MITYHDGDLLKSGCAIICHQVNVQGVMGGGLALQIARKYPDCERAYKEYVRMENGRYSLLGCTYWHKTQDGQIIANCFTQRENFDTDYSALKTVFENVREYAEYFELSVGIPYKYGCGIANGDWSEVERIIKEVFENSSVDCQIWRYDR